MHWETKKKLCDSLYCSIHFIEVVQNQTHNISEVRLYTDLFLDSLFCYFIYLTKFKPKTTSFLLLLLYSSSPIIFKVISAIQDPQHFPMNFKTKVQISIKKFCCDFYQDCVESIDKFWENFYHNTSALNQEHGKISLFT